MARTIVPVAKAPVSQVNPGSAHHPFPVAKADIARERRVEARDELAVSKAPTFKSARGGGSIRPTRDVEPFFTFAV
jgi:hypothetical protein